jgi:polysaccharide export outer membrane protein
LALLATLLLSAPLQGQSSSSGTNGALTRQQLEASAAAAEREASTDAQRQEAAAIRQRLRDGDFQVGDRVVVSVQGETFLTDTFTVRAGRMISIPNLPDISLQGVLRSELANHLTREIGKYVRDPSVRATSLVRISVMGEVSQPGFYAVPADFLASDVIMAAGGPTQLADTRKSELRRNNKVLIKRQALQQAITNGETLDRLDIRAGDELVVGRKTQRDWRTIAYVSGSVLGLIGAVIALVN